jgi:cell division transport system permease protein
MGLFLLAAGAIAVYNVHELAQKLPERFSMTVYLKDEATAADAEKVLSALRINRQVERAVYISRDAALKELKGALKDSSALLDGLDENPLPASVEIRLRKDYLSTSAVKKLASQIKGWSGVEDVQYGEQFLASIQSIMAGVRSVGIAALGVLLIAVLFVCYSTVKILFYRRTDEVETQKLLGATGWFIRAPFLLEGSIIGLAGGAAAAAALYALLNVSLAGFAQTIPVVRYLVVPSAALLALPLAGLFIGFTGALVALGRIRF